MVVAFLTIVLDGSTVVFDGSAGIVFQYVQIGDDAGAARKRDLAGICDSAVRIFYLAVYVIYLAAFVVIDAGTAAVLVIILYDAARIIDYTAVFVGDDARSIVLNDPANIIINFTAIHVVDGTGVVDGIGIFYGAAVVDGAYTVDSPLVVDGACVFNIAIGLVVDVTAGFVDNFTVVFDCC